MQLPLTLAVRSSHPLARLLCPRDVATLTLRADGLIGIEYADGTHAEGAVHPDTTVFPWLVVLLCRVGGRLESLTLPPMAMDIETYRQLRVWLKWKARVEGEKALRPQG